MLQICHENRGFPAGIRGVSEGNSLNGLRARLREARPSRRTIATALRQPVEAVFRHAAQCSRKADDLARLLRLPASERASTPTCEVAGRQCVGTERG